jgi:GDP-L-fucose synthase
MTQFARIYVAGHRGMVGSAIVRALRNRGRDTVVSRTHSELDLADQASVRAFLQAERPEQIYIAAAKVGGIHANATYPAEFIYRNLAIETTLIHEAWHAGIRRILFLGSSCIYPRQAEQPMREDALLTGPLEPTNEPYAIAKIAGIKLCESYNRQYGATDGVDYRSVMPTNLYGPGDNYDPQESHVIPGLLRRFHDAHVRGESSVSVWGTGTPRREFLHVDDLADACVHLMGLEKGIYDAHTKPMQSHINIGFGEDIPIGDLARLIASIVGYRGRIEFDASKPDGAPRKLLDSSLVRKLGWRPRITLEGGLLATYADFVTRGTGARG